MGCDKICQAKKEAAKAQAEADKAMNAAPPAGPKIPGIAYPTGTAVKIITVGHVLGVHEKKNALTPLEMFALLGVARGNTQVTANNTAKDLITPIQVAFGVYAGLIISQVAISIVKPAVKIAVQINGIIVFNFAMLPELIADIALLILMIFVGLAPIFLSLLKNIFLSIPLDVGIMTTYQIDQLKTLIALSKITIKSSFMTVVLKLKAFNAIKIANDKAILKASLGGTIAEIISYAAYTTAINNFVNSNSPPYLLSDIINVEVLRQQFIKDFIKGMNSCKEIILEELSALLKEQEVDILNVDGMSTFDLENKNKAKNVANGLFDATKKIELLQSGEILKRQFSTSGALPSNDGQIFDDNDLAEAAADNMIKKLEKLPADVDEIFLMVFNDEVEKKKAKTLEIREDIAAIELAQELILQNKNSFISSMVDKIDEIRLDKLEIIGIDPCYEQSVTNDFTILKSITEIEQFLSIENFVVTNTVDMISLKDTVFNETKQSIIDKLIVVDPACQTSFGESICNTINVFKRVLYSKIKISIEGGTIPVDNLEIPIGIDKFELKKMMDILLTEIKKKLVKQGMDIIIEEVLPCKSCKPCEDMIVDMNIFISKTIQKAKDNMILNVTNFIINTGHDWTITDSNSIVAQKNYLKNQLSTALQKPSGELQLIDDMMFRLELEEKELIKNVKTSLKAV